MQPTYPECILEKCSWEIEAENEAIKAAMSKQTDWNLTSYTIDDWLSLGIGIVLIIVFFEIFGRYMERIKKTLDDNYLRSLNNGSLDINKQMK